MCAGAALRVLGLSRSTATPEALKLAFRELAKKWHPDRHPGPSKPAAEAKFKELQQAYQLLSAPGALREALRGPAGGGGPSSGGPGQFHGEHARGGSQNAGQQQWWGEKYGQASRPGYNPHGSYMGFGGGGAGGRQHWYEDTAAAAAAEDHSRMLRSWAGVALFAAGMFAVTYTGSRDRKAKERGELVDAWWNQSTRRYVRALLLPTDPPLPNLAPTRPQSHANHPSSSPTGPVRTRPTGGRSPCRTCSRTHFYRA
jgi:curved DNA-binding protein CbpA